MWVRLMIGIGLLFTAATANAAAPALHVAWQPWSEQAFAQAKAEHKLVLLDLEAVWCHWCHVMDEVTYQDQAVVRYIHEHVIALKVDQEARPDLAARYEDYGWPATILYHGDGTELAKRSGYLAPAAMLGMLKAFVKDPTPGPSAQVKPVAVPAGSAELPAALAANLRKLHDELYDEQGIGWGFQHKYLDWQSAEWALTAARLGDQGEAKRLAATLKMSLKLVDPAWGGVYQYSVERRWDAPHYEKIMQYQSEIMRLYALAGKQLQAPEYLQAAHAIQGFVGSFLTGPGGGFYTSMDADRRPGEQGDRYFQGNDQERRKNGLPRVDTHRYARENGWMILALSELYSADSEAQALAQAQAAAAWVQAERALPGGGYKHGDADQAGPYLGDNLAMGRALLNLYLVTGERSYLAQAEAAADFTGKNLLPRLAAPTAKAEATREELLQLTRWLNLLSHVTGRSVYKEQAEQCFRLVLSPAAATKVPTGGVLVAADELAHDPVHITIVGGKNDSKARALFQAALRYPAAYRQLEWWDRSEGPLPTAQQVAYPLLKEAAAFACSGTRCSLPLTAAGTLVERVKRLNKGPG